jgi:hypothetical protein
MKINNKQDVIDWLKRLKEDHPLSVDECRLQKSDGSMSSEKQKAYTDQVIKNRYQSMIDYLESDYVTSNTDSDSIDNNGDIPIKWTPPEAPLKLRPLTRDDVKHQAEGWLINLTDNEVDDVLYNIKNNHDASIGVNWDNIDFYIYEVVKEREK